MAELNEQLQSADWKKESTSHHRMRRCRRSGRVFDVKVSLGKAVAHPNTTEHHIRWISLYFHPDDEKQPIQVGHFEFSAHGESAQGATRVPYTPTMKPRHRSGPPRPARSTRWLLQHPWPVAIFQTRRSKTGA